MRETLDIKMDGSYQSQEAAIIRRTTEEGISTQKLDECFDVKLLEVKRQCHGQTQSHILARTEFLVWQHFCERTMSLYVFLNTTN